MDALLTLFGAALVIWILVGPVLAILALRRAKRAENDLLRLRRWVSRLDRGEHLLPRKGEQEAPATAGQTWSLDEVRGDEPSPSREPLPFRREEPEAPAAEPAADSPEPVTTPEPAASVAPVPPPVTPSKAAGPRQPIEWERWIGVRGAALLGGVLFALAAIFLYLHAVEQQWITPRSRVFSGTGAGLLLLGAAEYLRRRSFAFAPGAVAAAGIVALYASTWAAHELYAMIGQAPALAAFASITALCVGLALRHESQFVAVLGLLGGFATPLVLQMPAGNPITLFGYLLLLDAGLLMVGRRKAWYSLGLLGILATSAIEVYWALGYASPDEALIGLGALSALALLFIAGRPVLGRVEPVVAQLARGIVVLTPLLLGLYFAQRGDIQIELWVLASYGAFLALGGLVLSRRQGNPTIAVASAVALVSMVLAWAGGRELVGDDALRLCGTSAALIVLFSVAGRLEGSWTGRACSFAVQLGLLALLACFAVPRGGELQDSPWPWYGAAALSVVALLEHRALGWWRCAPCLVGGVLAAFALYLRTRPENAFTPPDGVVLGAALVYGIALTLAGFLSSRAGDRTRIFASAAAIAPLLVLFASRLVATPGGGYVAAMGALALCVAALATRARSGVLLQAAVVLASIAIPLHTLLAAGVDYDLDADDSWTFLAVLVTTGLLVAWPAVFRTSFARSTSAWRAAATAAPLMYVSVIQVFEEQVGRSWELIAPAFVALLLIATDALGARKLSAEERSPRGVPVRRVAHTWLRSMAAPFVAAALVQWMHEPIGVLWLSVCGAALAIVSRGVRHPGPAVWALACFVGAALALLVAGGERWYEKSEVLLFNRITLDAWVAALSAGVGVWCFTRHDRTPLELSRPWLQKLAKPLVVGSVLALATCLFQWINLTVFDHWTDRTRVAIRFDHLPARDLTLSSSWILYGLAWLGVGMWKRISAARWMSLAMLLLSLGKVFLFDLAHLEGLYRVASLLGLGLSLVAVSLLYQRFVFRNERASQPSSD